LDILEHRSSVESIGEDLVDDRPGFVGAEVVRRAHRIERVRPQRAVEIDSRWWIVRIDLLVQLGVADAEALATQLALLVDGSIAQDLVRDDPAMARAAKEAATVLLKYAGVKMGGGASKKRSKPAL
jgi:hypothetical protein